MKHTFVICAYKESEFLEECILSLKNQSISSELFIATSTPNKYIEAIAEKYGIEIFINNGQKGITQDWNFGLSKVRTRYATVAHQDDIYESSYSEKIIKTMEKQRNSIIAFSDYNELRKGKKIHNTNMLKIKRMMLSPLRCKKIWKSKFVRRRILSLGDPICCPAVTFDLNNVERPIFKDGFRSCEDWEAWENLSKLKGEFIYINEPLMCHRIHENSATTEIIHDNARVYENFVMYCKFWPKPIAKIINHFYTKSEKSNEI